MLEDFKLALTRKKIIFVKNILRQSLVDTFWITLYRRQAMMCTMQYGRRNEGAESRQDVEQMATREKTRVSAAGRKRSRV